MTRGQGAVLAAIVAASALLLALEGAVLPTAWLPVEEAAILARARGGGAVELPSAGLLYPLLLAPAAHSVSAAAAYELAKALGAVLWAAVAIPAYLLARRLVPPAPALAVAGLSVAVPGAIYATAAVADALAVLLATFALALLARASERGSPRELAAALSLAAAAALARPWLAVLPFALIVAYGLPRPRWRASLRWPRPLALAALAGPVYLALATSSPAAEVAFTSPGATARAALASLAVAVVGVGVVPWLLAASGARAVLARPESTLLATCLPALALAAGVLGAADPARGVDERPLLVLAPLVLALAAAAWLGSAVRLRAAALAGFLIVLAALALPALGPTPVSRAAGLSVISGDGGSRALLVAGVAAVVGIALLLLSLLRRRRVLLPTAVAVVLVVGQVAAWSSVRGEARRLAAAEPAPHGWVDLNAGPGEEVAVVGPVEGLDQPVLADLTLWNRSVRRVRELNFLDVDPHSGQLGIDPAADLVLVRGPELIGTQIARSAAGVLLRPYVPLNLASTVEGVYPDGWSGEQAIYRRFSGGAGAVHVVLSRAGAPADAPPATVVIESGPLDTDAREPQARFVLGPGAAHELDVELPDSRYDITVSVTPTFAAADGRQLSARIRFTFRPRR